MGSALASGENRAIEAVKGAMNSPLLNDHDIHGASFVLLNITNGKEEILMDEIMEITDFIQDAAGDNAEVIWGYGYGSSLEHNISVTLVATGFSSNNSTANVFIPERKVMSLNDEDKKEIKTPMSSPFEAGSLQETPLDEPYLKQQVMAFIIVSGPLVMWVLVMVMVMAFIIVSGSLVMLVMVMVMVMAFIIV